MVWEKTSKLWADWGEEYVPRMEQPRVARSRAMARPMPFVAPLVVFVRCVVVR
jgi:hypothetical protein